MLCPSPDLSHLNPWLWCSRPWRPIATCLPRLTSRESHLSGPLFSSPLGQPGPLPSCIHEEPRTRHTCGLLALSFLPPPEPFFPPCPLSLPPAGHEGGTIQAGLGASEPLRLGWGAPMTALKQLNQRQKLGAHKIRGGQEWSCFLLSALTFTVCRGTLAATASHLTSHLLSSPPVSLLTLTSPAFLACLRSHLIFQDRVPLLGLKVLQACRGR